MAKSELNPSAAQSAAALIDPLESEFRRSMDADLYLRSLRLRDGHKYRKGTLDSTSLCIDGNSCLTDFVDFYDSSGVVASHKPQLRRQIG